MIAVLNPSDSITAAMSGAAAATNPTYMVDWQEANGEGFNQATSQLDGATAVTLVPAPTASQRYVSRLHIYNGDTAAVTVTITKIVSGTSYTVLTYTIGVGAVLRWTADGIDILAATVVTGAGAATANVTASEQGNGVLQKTVLTLDGVSVTVGNTTGVSFGGTKIYDFPAGRILILGATIANVSFDLTDAGNVTPIDAADGGDIAVGTTVAGDGTLTNADVDIIPSTGIDPLSGGVDGAALAASAQFDGTTDAIDAYFNILIDDADVGDGAEDVLLVSGTLTISWINLGTY